MVTILDRIIEQKKKEVLLLQEAVHRIPQIEFPKRSLIHKLNEANELSIIAEFKRASPSKGLINNGIDPVQQAAMYEESGATAISVLTDQSFFKGSFSDLQRVRETVDLPILCKDFIIDPLQINVAAANGADLILLIAAALDENRLNELYQYARSKDLEVLVEVHNQEELEKVLHTSARLIGVNNRDLKTFHVSLEVTETLALEVKKSGAFLISESGIHCQEDAERVRNAGANGILVGEALMTSRDVKNAFLDLRLPLQQGINE
ncbi:indole-3-glycerol phosphate synthase TrpC [Neobacillus sp. OS1-2]|uniref:indole-3-glycerol phosphate synthase TrpC n=1 Tax=Neobacillus sp. OS1-2 TaxID=3070680 RepID=UPI0027DF0DEA|nr:indole-3-glycerol phosphate synthase TrpC [Neobacillus sp. OS1-2]WML40181.1 indole-3-glycerol phosphate synthase TrpC [Neobacillus sp. OS1-2]